MTASLIALIACLCLVCFILGMIAMSLILHPYRQEVKRLRKTQEEYRRYQQRMRNLNK